VADVLSKKPRGTLAFLTSIDPYLPKELKKLQIEIILLGDSTRLAALQISSSIVDKIKEGQQKDPELLKLSKKVEEGSTMNFTLKEGLLRYRGRLCVPKIDELRKELLKESHESTLSTHPGSTKMYPDLKSHYCWPGLKKDIAEFVTRCLTCQRVKTEHQKPGGLLQPLPIPVWKWGHITMDFIVGLPRTQTKHDAIWIVVDRLTKSAHFIAIKTVFNAEQLAHLYLKEIVQLCGIPLSIVLDRDTKFVSKFWQGFQSTMGTVVY